MAIHWYSYGVNTEIFKNASYKTGRTYAIADYNGQSFGGDSNPVNYRVQRSESNYYFWYYATLDGTINKPRFILAHGGSVNTAGEAQMIFGLDVGSAADDYLQQIGAATKPTKQIRGKYQFKSIMTLLSYTMSSPDSSSTVYISCPFQFIIDNVQYEGISFSFNPSKEYKQYVANGITLYKADGSFDKFSNVQSFINAYKDKMINFGDAPLELPSMIVDWFNTNAIKQVKTLDLSTLGLSVGDHYIRVKAKADGLNHGDSDLSNEVVYTV